MVQFYVKLHFKDYCEARLITKQMFLIMTADQPWATKSFTKKKKAKSVTKTFTNAITRSVNCFNVCTFFGYDAHACAVYRNPSSPQRFPFMVLNSYFIKKKRRYIVYILLVTEMRIKV